MSHAVTAFAARTDQIRVRPPESAHDEPGNAGNAAFDET